MCIDSFLIVGLALLVRISSKSLVADLKSNISTDKALSILRLKSDCLITALL